jgi:hypothetical protein
MRGCLFRAFRFRRRASGDWNGRARNPTIRSIVWSGNGPDG